MVRANLEESFLSRTEPLPWSGCLIWTGGVTLEGYGVLWTGEKSVYAHRYAYEQEYGPVPDGEVVDHLYHCDKACAEPTHLRSTTRANNVRHRAGANRTSKTGVRNVHLLPSGRYRVMVRVGGKAYGHVHRTLEAAEAEAIALRRELFGEFAGRG